MITFSISAEPLPENFAGTPQGIFDALLDRLTIQSDLETYNDGPTEPAPDSGPWFKNGVELYGWNGSAYVPSVVPEIAPQQIQAGETAPDHLEFSYWLKTSGSVVLGLFYYMGTEAGWVSQVYGVPNGSITSDKIQPGSITTEKIALNSVPDAAIRAPLPISKWAPGTSRQFLRMDAAGGAVGWQSIYFASPLLTVNASAPIEWAHGLGTTPNFVRGVFVNETADGGWVPGDEVPFELWTMINAVPGYAANSVCPCLFRGPTRVATRLVNTVYCVQKSDLKTGFTATLSRWKFKFYVSKA
jgi:hypothetical protein